MGHEETAAADFSPVVSEFLRNHIQSVWQLELLQFLRSSGASLTAADIAAHLYSNTREVESALSNFARDGVLSAEHSEQSKYTFAPSNPDLLAAIEQSLAAYTTKRLAVIDMIFSRNNSKEG